MHVFAQKHAGDMIHILAWVLARSAKYKPEFTRKLYRVPFLNTRNAFVINVRTEREAAGKHLFVRDWLC